MAKIGGCCRNVGAGAVTMSYQKRKVETGCFSESQASSPTLRRTRINTSASLVIREMGSA